MIPREKPVRMTSIENTLAVFDTFLDTKGTCQRKVSGFQKMFQVSDSQGNNSKVSASQASNSQVGNSRFGKS